MISGNSDINFVLMAPLCFGWISRPACSFNLSISVARNQGARTTFWVDMSSFQSKGRRVMQCPACFNELSPFHVGSVAVDVCQGSCGGIWFDAFELQRVD